MRVSVAEPDLVGSITEVAVTVTLVGSPSATVGAVYKPEFASIVPPFSVVTAQVTAPLPGELLTVAENCAVWPGHPLLFG